MFTTISSTDSTLPRDVSSSMLQAGWTRLSREEAEWIEGKRHRLLHAIVTRYGTSRDDAERQIDQFLRGVRTTEDDSSTS